MKKKILATVLAAAMAFSLTACGGSKTSSTQAGAAKSGEPVTLEQVDKSQTTELIFWHNRGGAAGECLEKIMIPEFNDTVGKEMGIKITPVYQSSSDLISKLKALILAGDVENMPDLVQVFAGDTEYMSTVSYVVPVADLIAQDDSFNTDELLPQLVNTYTYAGKLNSLPFHASTMTMYYNKTAFEEAGLDPEAPPETLAEVAEAAGKLLKKDSSGVKQYAITMGIQNAYLNHFIAGQGEYSYIGDHENGHAGRMTKVEFDTNGTMKKFLTEWKKVLDTGAVQTVDEGTQARDEFMAGTSAMMFSSNSVLESMENVAEEKGFELGVVPLPKVTAEDSGGVCPGGSSIYVFDRGDGQKIAKSWVFMKTWVSAEYQSEWVLATGCIPVNQKAMDTEGMKEYIEKRPEFNVAYNALIQSDPHIQEHLAPTQQAFTTIFKENGEKFAAGELSVDECVAAMAEACNAALDEYNRANPIEQ